MSDDQLREAVDAVFGQYDKDNSGTLSASEVSALINDALKHMGNARQVTKEEIDGFMKAVDVSGDGNVSKPELLAIFKKVLA